jgi:hypothetical protein
MANTGGSHQALQPAPAPVPDKEGSRSRVPRQARLMMGPLTLAEHLSLEFYHRCKVVSLLLHPLHLLEDDVTSPTS